MSSFWQNPKNLVGIAVLILAAFILLKFIKPILTLLILIVGGYLIYQYIRKNN